MAFDWQPSFFYSADTRTQCTQNPLNLTFSLPSPPNRYARLKSLTQVCHQNMSEPSTYWSWTVNGRRRRIVCVCVCVYNKLMISLCVCVCVYYCCTPKQTLWSLWIFWVIIHEAELTYLFSWPHLHITHLHCYEFILFCIHCFSSVSVITAFLFLYFA